MSGPTKRMEAFPENSRAALADSALRGALRHATETFAGRRAAAVKSVPDWPELRRRAREIKDATLADLPRWLELFEERASSAGTQVHWAEDAAQANELVLGIARAAGARTLVKSKSMTTEETGLNAALEEAGLLPVETDLGEYIIQLAGEAPSHIIVPAIHKTRGEIGRLFAEQLAVDYTDDPKALTELAREVLRGEFARADLGISGANFAVAETGSFLVLENEGNARMCTSLPRVHVAVIGIEKVLPRLADLEVFLALLPRSGTGQHLTTYQTLFTGPRQEGGEGPEELHVVLLDNGRSQMLREEVTRASLACIRCGACLNVCPVYGAIGGHAYGSVYPGPIGACVTPQLCGLERARHLPFASSLCGACREVCPMDIDLPRLLLHLRSRIASAERETKRGKETRSWRLWAWAMRDPRRYALLSEAARLSRGTLQDRGTVEWLARFVPALAAWLGERDLRPPAARSFRELWKAEHGEDRDVE